MAGLTLLTRDFCNISISISMCVYVYNFMLLIWRGSHARWLIFKASLDGMDKKDHCLSIHVPADCSIMKNHFTISILTASLSIILYIYIWIITRSNLYHVLSLIYWNVRTVSCIHTHIITLLYVLPFFMPKFNRIYYSDKFREREKKTQPGTWNDRYKSLSMLSHHAHFTYFFYWFQIPII